MASPSLLLLTPPVPPSWRLETPVTGLLLRLTLQLRSVETTLLSEADFFMAKLVEVEFVVVVAVVVRVDPTDRVTNIVMWRGTEIGSKYLL